MKRYLAASFFVVLALGLGSCAPEEINTEFSVTQNPLPLIPAKAVSCYSAKIAAASSSVPSQDIEADYFRIPIFKFWRANNSKALIINNIRITYTIPSAGGQSGGVLKCEISGDELRALKASWWSGGPEATIPKGEGSQASPFETDCAALCGGINTTMTNFTTSGTVEVFGLERDVESGDETPVKLQSFITIQSF